MSLTLEEFAKEVDMALFFKHEVIRITTLRGGKSELIYKNIWYCGFEPPSFSEDLYYEDRNGGMGNLFPCGGKTRQKARRDFIKDIRGKTLCYGNRDPYRIKVPRNLR